MTPLPGQRVLVLGRDSSGTAASALLRARGAEVRQADLPIDPSRPPEWGGPAPDLVVVSAACQGVPDWVRDLAARGIPVLGERELAFEQSFCLHIAITGGAGKSTTAALVAHLLRAAGRRVEVADASLHPACSFAEASRDLDLLVHAVQPAEFEFLPCFRPAIGVLLNLPPPGSDSALERQDEVRRVARLFAHQQAFDWAIIQADALAELEAAGVRPPGKLVTFAAGARKADLGVDRGLLVSHWEGWIGPLWDMDRGRLRGPHFAEDVLAALAVGRVLRIALEELAPALETFVAGPGRLESLGEADGIRFVDDGRAASMTSLEKALLTLAPTASGTPFIRLVAGGDAVRGAPYDLGPTLSSRVRQVRLFGPAAPALQAAWNLFTPCSVELSLLNAVRQAVDEAAPGEVVLFSPACPLREPLPGSSSVAGLFREVVQARLARPSLPSPVPSSGPEANKPPT